MSGEFRPSVSVRDATLADLAEVATWVGTADECRLWAGPAVSFPLRLDVLAREICMDSAASVTLDDGDGPAAFGQVLWRPPARGHLGRVIVRPGARGHGLGRALVSALLDRARAGEARVASLRVYAENEPAVRLYEAAGFRVGHPPPEEPASASTLYLVRALTPAERGPARPPAPGSRPAAVPGGRQPGTVRSRMIRDRQERA